VLHEPGDGAFAKRFEEEMNMIGHEAEGVDTNLVAPGEGIEAIEIEDEVGGVTEDVLALGAALVDMVDLTALEVAKAGRVRLGVTRHSTDKWVEGPRVLTYFRLTIVNHNVIH